MTPKPSSLKTAVIAAGGTGGHIFPGLALAEELRSRGWSVAWMGTGGSHEKPSMESKIVPKSGIKFHALNFSGVRGTGLKARLTLPFRLMLAVLHARRLLIKAKPTVVIGFGGYPSVPAGIAAKLTGTPLLLHEQNAIPGMANRWLARWAHRTYTAFPVSMPNARFVGNPLRQDFLEQSSPEQRFKHRSGPLRLLVLGGSAGATALNEALPAALKKIPEPARPMISHQSGVAHLDGLKEAYRKVGVECRSIAFIDDLAQEMAAVDLIICRSGASTVTEIAAIGAAAVFVPYPFAVDDHQTANARHLVDEGGGWILPQSKLTPERLSKMLLGADRATLLAAAQASHRLAKRDATFKMAEACEIVAQQEGQP